MAVEVGQLPGEGAAGGGDGEPAQQGALAAARLTADEHPPMGAESLLHPDAAAVAFF